MIIGISGKIGSGKDTVGKMIQYLTASSMGSHSLATRTTLLTSLKYEEWTKGFRHPRYLESSWHIKKFAAKLKQVCSLLTGIDIHDFEIQEVKDRLLGKEWYRWQGMINQGAWESEILQHWPSKEQALQANMSEYERENLKEFKPTVRWLLQTVGTEAMRGEIHANVWVNALFVDYKSTGSYYRQTKHSDKLVDDMVGGERNISSIENLINAHNEETSIYPNWVITDTRFPNEAKAITKHDGILIRVERLETDGKAGNHPSETSLDNYTFDHIIHNNGTLDELLLQVQDILKYRKIIE